MPSGQRSSHVCATSARARTVAAAGGVTQTIHVLVEAVDGIAVRAEAAGAETLIPLAGQDYGDRS